MINRLPVVRTGEVVLDSASSLWQFAGVLSAFSSRLSICLYPDAGTAGRISPLHGGGLAAKVSDFGSNLLKCC